MFWCFKYMVCCRDQVDRHQNRVPELNPKVLLDAFLEFKIPAQVPLGVRSVAWCISFLVSPLLVESNVLPVFPGLLNTEISYGTFLTFFVDLSY